jgi:hypothetical protein
MPETTQFTHDTEDLALLFIEEEVGRFDWRNNWPAIQAAGLGLERVDNWLRTIKVEHDAQQIVAFLDQMVRDRSGRWL